MQFRFRPSFKFGNPCLRERLDDLIDPDSLRVSGVPTGVRKGEPGCYKHWTGPGGGPWAPPWGVIQGGPEAPPRTYCGIIPKKGWTQPFRGTTQAAGASWDGVFSYKHVREGKLVKVLLEMLSSF